MASKATGYPLAYIAAKLSLGYSLLEIKNSITRLTACYEPSLDYCVVKVPRWDLRKFPMVDDKLGSSMKSVGEVMSISRSFEEAFQKALRMANENILGFYGTNKESVSTEDELMNPNNNRINKIANSFYSGQYDVDQMYDLTKIDKWYLKKLWKIIEMQKKLEALNGNINKELLHRAKRIGFSDYQIAGMQESIVLQSNSSEILNKFLATNHEWELKFGIELAVLLSQNIDLILETEAICSARLRTLLEIDRSVFHTDLHPHNVIINVDKAIIIDVDSLKVAGWPSSLGFCFYKLVRQTIVNESIKNINLSEVREFFETISSSFVSQNNRVELCYLGALTEVLRRIIIIFEGNLDGNLSPWNQVLGIQVRALSEIRFIFGRFL